MTAPLTAEQREAVAACHADEGPAWRRWLAKLWETAGPYGIDPEMGASLQGLRNSHGPTWLANVHTKDVLP
ncbi:hypothetical protein [Sphingomonas sp. HMP6]|uniref:hypothetical protein n=1 Tax=Sphingomonas sp. HMP6 TaxID=1517551 RepID=UPI0015965EDF|nr:hypothetical protein [Sphingomonas sp. HMP6]BCA57703.1 hypothetical protein HMP06_0472 [Sphingomonas sp. HMP6]